MKLIITGRIIDIGHRSSEATKHVAVPCEWREKERKGSLYWLPVLSLSPTIPVGDSFKFTIYDQPD